MIEISLIDFFCQLNKTKTYISALFCKKVIKVLINNIIIHRSDMKNILKKNKYKQMCRYLKTA